MAEVSMTGAILLTTGEVRGEVGAFPWIDTRDDAASYISFGGNVQLRMHFPDIGAAQSFGLVARLKTDSAQSRRWLILSTPHDDMWADGYVDPTLHDWADSRLVYYATSTPVALTSPVGGGPFDVTLWALQGDGIPDTDGWYLTYLALVTDEQVVPPIRRTFPRPDGRAGGAPRTFPPSPTIQSGNRTSGAIF